MFATGEVVRTNGLLAIPVPAPGYDGAGSGWIPRIGDFGSCGSAKYNSQIGDMTLADRRRRRASAGDALEPARSPQARDAAAVVTGAARVVDVLDEDQARMTLGLRTTQGSLFD